MFIDFLLIKVYIFHSCSPEQLFLMKIKVRLSKLQLFISFLIALVVPTIVFSASSDFLNQASKYIDNNCSKSSISNQIALLCYLFEKDKEQDTVISSNTDRVANLEASNSSLKKSDFYVKMSGSYKADPASAHTIVFGCDPGDVAVGGGASQLSGNINNWVTAFSHPYPDPQGQEGVNAGVWETTVVNNNSQPEYFSVMARCLKIRF